MTLRAPSNGREQSLDLLARVGLAVAALSTCFTLASYRPGGGGGGPSSDVANATAPAPVTAPAVEYELAPDGDWIAIWTHQSNNELDRAWAVSLVDGSVRTLDHLELACDRLGWDDDGNLRVQVIDPTRSLSEMRWIDLDTGRVVESTRDRERIRRELQPEAWATIRAHRLGDGATAFTVVGPDGEELLEVSGDEGTRCVLADRPGIAFVSTPAGEAIHMKAVDLEHATERRFAQLAASTLLVWWPSPSGNAVLLLENGLERRARVIDSSRGMLLHGPWLADQATWVEGARGRYVALTRGPRNLVYDTLRDREIELLGYDGRWPRLVALEDGRFVLESELRIEVRDADMRLQRVLYDPAARD